MVVVLVDNTILTASMNATNRPHSGVAAAALPHRARPLALNDDELSSSAVSTGPAQ